MECDIDETMSTATTGEKTKNNRGTRRQQRYRAKQKLWQLCELASAQKAPVVDVNIDIHIVDEIGNRVETSTATKDEHRRSMKRKRDAVGSTAATPTTLMPDAAVIHSLSQLKIDTVVAPRHKKSRALKSQRKKKQQQQQQLEKQKKRKKKHSTALPDYLNVPNRIFINMFLAAAESIISHGDQSKIIRNWLENTANMQYLRAHACLLDKLLYLQLQKSLWTTYLNAGTATAAAAAEGDGIWASEVQEKISRFYSSNSTDMCPLSFVTDYCNQIDEQIQKTEAELSQHVNNLRNPTVHSNSQVQSIDFSAILKAFVRRGQHKLNAEFQCKKRLLQFDQQDHRLTKAFYDLKPTTEQIQFAKKIWTATLKQQTAEEQVMMLKHRLASKSLPKTFDQCDRLLEEVDHSLRRSTVIDKDACTTIMNRRQKLVGQFKLDMMAISISTAEATARAHARIAREQTEKMRQQIAPSDNVVDDVNEERMNNLVAAIQTRQENIIRRAQYVTACKVSFFDDDSDVDYFNCWQYHRSQNNNKTASKTSVNRRKNQFNSLPLPPSAIVEVATSFTNRHLLVLARGPKYVAKCQSQFASRSSSSKSKSISKIIEREYQKMSHVIRNSLADNCVSASDERAKLFFASLKDLLTRLYSTKLSCSLFRRIRQEYILIKQMQRQLSCSSNRIVLRRTDKSKVFHLGNTVDYEEKSKNYMQRTGAYEEVKNGRCPLVDNLSAVITLLDKLVRNGAISRQQYSRMIPNRDQVELGHLYFLPKPHKVGTPLRPIISSMKGPSNGVSHFLDRLLRPLFDHVAQHTTFINGIDLVRQLENYRDRGCLWPSTQFVTFDVTDLYTMIPRDGALEALGRFLLHNSVQGKIGNMSVDTILKLARLVLDTNYFVYDQKYYRQIKGGAMGSPFTMTLANVYMLEWEQSLIQSQFQQGELYGRYIDDVFMTSNMPVDVIRAQLDQMNAKDAKAIQITYSIGLSAQFLDVHIENCHGSLQTTVFHKPAAEPYVLPFSSDHPRHVHINIPYEALLRAARYCSHVDLFDQERLNIEMVLLVNGYPARFIQRHFTRFFRLNSALQVRTELDAQQYQQLHHKLLNLPTRREKKMKKKGNNSACMKQFDQDDGQSDTKKKEEEEEQQQKKMWNKKILVVPYTYESGPLLILKREFRQLWTKTYVYSGSIMKNVRVIMTAASNPSLDDLLVRKKPSRLLLTKMDTGL